MGELRNKTKMLNQLKKAEPVLEIIKDDKGFSFFFSQEHLHVYYNGYTMCKISTRNITLGNDLKKIEGQFDIHNINKYKEIMDDFKSSNPKVEERKLQQHISCTPSTEPILYTKVRERKNQHSIANGLKFQDNAYVVLDCEFASSTQYTGKNANFDCIILKIENGKIEKAYATEYKCTGSYSGKCGIEAHAKDFINLSQSKEFMKELKESIVITFDILSKYYKLGFVGNYDFSIEFAFLFTDLTQERTEKSLYNNIKKVFKLSKEHSVPFYIWKYKDEKDAVANWSEPTLLTEEYFS